MTNHKEIASEHYMEASYGLNDVIGETFSSYHSMEATYISASKVPEGFYNIIMCLPSRVRDHVIYGKRADGEYIGISQPYPIGIKTIERASEYCQMVGMEMIIGGRSTWNDNCTRIMFQRDDKHIDRFNIAVNSSRWHDGVHQGDTEDFINKVMRRLENCGSMGV